MKSDNPSYTSPAGIAQYPRLVEPDTKYNPDGEFKVTLELNAAESQEMMNFLDEQYKRSQEKAKKDFPGKKIKQGPNPYEVDDDTGKVTVKFKTKAKVTMRSGDSFDQKVALFDAKGKPLVNPPNVGGGSKIKVSYQVVPYYTATVGAGLTLRMKAVQIIKLVEYTSGANASSYGFKEEDGYEAEEQTFTDETQEDHEEDVETEDF